MAKILDIPGYAFTEESVQEQRVAERHEVKSRVLSPEFKETHLEYNSRLMRGLASDRYTGQVSPNWEPVELAIHLAGNSLPFGALVYIADSGAFTCTIYTD